MDFSSLMALVAALYNLPNLVATIGYLGLAVMIYAETGLFFGFFFPGSPC